MEQLTELQEARLGCIEYVTKLHAASYANRPSYSASPKTIIQEAEEYLTFVLEGKVSDKKY